MARKRDTHGQDWEALLGEVISGLESESARKQRSAMSALLLTGPLFVDHAVYRALDESPVVDTLERAELVAFLRGSVHNRNRGVFSPPLSLLDTPTFSVSIAGPLTACGVTGTPRDVMILQLVMLLEHVGMENVRKCDARDCERLYVRAYRRTFCSLRCQKRAQQQRRRAVERDELAKQARLRQRRRRVSRER